MSSTEIGQIIRLARKNLALSQVSLSALSGVSLPSIQNIEASKANPSLSTVEQLFSALGLRLRFEFKKASWQTLSELGLPLWTKKSNGIKKTTNKSQALIQGIREACMELSYSNESSKEDDFLRKKESIQALLLALKTHYPSFYKKHISSPLTENFDVEKPSGRLKKLRRQALAMVAEYL
ncbi:MAG: helix-turn-helix domain-containing protein [Bacteriovoracia bacterium]